MPSKKEAIIFVANITGLALMKSIGISIKNHMIFSRNVPESLLIRLKKYQKFWTQQAETFVILKWL